MKSLSVALLLVFLQPPGVIDQPGPRPHLPQPIECDGSETPCNPDKPWMRGMTEKSCTRAHELEELKALHPNRIILACECQHMCDPESEHAAETDGRVWDGLCQARCNPKNCVCPSPCDS